MRSFRDGSPRPLSLLHVLPWWLLLLPLVNASYEFAGSIFGGSGNDYVYRVATNTTNVLIGGHFFSPTLTVGSRTISNTDASGTTADMILIMLRAGGSGVVWSRNYGGSGR
jgi:hypothetical protein